MESAPPRLLVAGATGYLGGHVLRLATERGLWTRALSRRPDPLPATEVFQGEATRPETLGGLCEGIDVVFSSLGIRSFKRRPTVWEVDLQANLNLLQTAVSAGVRHFVFVSAFRADTLRRAGNDVAEARERVVDAIRAAGLTATIIRPTGFFNDMEEMFQMAQSGTGWVPGDGTLRMNPIHGADLAARVVEIIEDPALHEQEHPLGGPGTHTVSEILGLAFRAVGGTPKIRHLPVWMLRAVRTVARPFNGNFAGFVHAMELMGGGTVPDMVAPSTGEYRLEDFFASLAAEAARGAAPLRSG